MKIIQNSLLLLLLLAFALAGPMDSSEKEGPDRDGPGELNELQKSEKTKESNKLAAVALDYPMESTEPSRYPLPKVTTENLLEIIQKFDFNSLYNTVSNLKLDLNQILKHESSIQGEVFHYQGITLKAVFHQLKIQYQIAPDMMNQIYKSIPLSVLVRLKAPA